MLTVRVKQMEFPEIMDGDPFDIFFDNEALSDRTLYIVEVEEVRLFFYFTICWCYLPLGS